MNDRKIYKLTALDMDGTLLTPDKRLLDETVRDIAAYAQAGGIPVFCSGRTATEIGPYQSMLPAMRYAVCENGALIWDYKEQRSLSERPLDLAFAERIIEVGNRFDGMLQFLTPDASWTRRDQVTHMADFLMAAYQPIYMKVARLADDMLALARSLPKILKINIYFRSPEDRAAGYELLKDMNVSFAFTEIAVLEMSAIGVDKGSGLEILAEKLGIPMEQTMAIGDAGNDLEMLKAAAFPVAMGNATDEVKALCLAVTDDDLNNGVGKAIRCWSGLFDEGAANAD
ncbi:MAG: Cof-type HAD-IIB family hydrolase [Firmicutes bacterium]|nr:Cof-type HAD-IIB family hydrolase [Bacillota bacterium]